MIGEGGSLHDQGADTPLPTAGPEPEAVIDELMAALESGGDVAREIALCRRALQLITKERDPDRWAALNVILGDLAIRQQTGDKASEVELAIASYEAALEVYKPERHPDDWAETKASLGDAYAERVRGNRWENLDAAIACYESALQVFTREAEPERWAPIQANLGSACLDQPRGDRPANVEKAVGSLREALEVIDRGVMPSDWAKANDRLGAAYRARVQGDRAEDVERAIACYERALEVRTRAAMPLEWAATKAGLGNAYRDRVRGDLAENLEKAIACYEQSLELRTRERSPRLWAKTRANLGSAYADRLLGDRADNLETAIACYEAAVEETPVEESPREWALIQGSLGTTYGSRVRGDRAANMEKAIAHHEAALRVHTRQALPWEWATTQYDLGVAYRERVLGSRADNLEASIAFFERALEVRRPETLPREWATTQNSLGLAYAQRVRGDRADNLQTAIGCYHAALGVRTQEALPWEWAVTQNNLGNAYADQLLWDRADNLERAIACYEATSKVHTRDVLPLEWAQIQANLGNAYADRIRGNRAENLEAAIRYFRAALTVHTREALPWEWAHVLTSLGSVYLERVEGDRAENLELAIACYEQALDVRTRQALPREWALTQSNLGIAYRRRVRGDPAANLDASITCSQGALEVFREAGLLVEVQSAGSGLGRALGARERWVEAAAAYREAVDATDVLYAASVLMRSKEAELAEAADLPARLAYASARAEDAKGAAVALERTRARALGEALARDRAQLGELASTYPDIQEAYRRASEAVRAAQARERRLASTATNEDGAAQVRSLHDEARAARDDFETALEAMRNAGALPASLLPPDWEDVAGVVTQERPLAYLLTQPEASLIALCHRAPGDSSGSGPVVAETIWSESFGSADLDSVLAERRDGEVVGGYVLAQLGADQPGLAKALDSSLPMVGAALMAPLAARLAELGAGAVTLVPCGWLGLLPLHAATWATEGEKRCLLDQADVVFAPSARVQAAARDTLASMGEDSRVLAGVGNPLPSRRPLTYARAELGQIATHFGEAARPLYEEKATRAALDAAAARASYLHPACHGTYDPFDPLASHLELSDGPFTLSDILAGETMAGMRLVVASACQTAVAGFTRLPDEVVGLPAGFLEAGAAGVVGTLWAVNDLSTALLLERFYRCHLQGDPTTGDPPLDPPAALARAQHWLAHVTAGELFEYFDARAPKVSAGPRISGVSDSPAPTETHEISKSSRAPGASNGHHEEAASGMPAEVAVYGAMRFELEDPAARPFADPYHWAAFVVVGA